MTEREFYDAIVVVPLEEELREILNIFTLTENRSTEDELRYIAINEKSGIKVLIALQHDMGRTEAIISTTKLLEQYDATIMVSMGIAASLSKDTILGDVCYTGSILDIYDNSKSIDKSPGISDIKLSPSYYATPKTITMPLNFFRLLPEYSNLYNNWQIHCRDNAIDIAGNTIFEKYINRPPLASSGLIACGIVSASKTYNESIVNLNRRVLALDTESGGLFHAAQSRGVDALTIRGISDYADDSKSKVESESRGAIRKIAAGNAASFFWEQTSEGPFCDYLLRKRERSATLPFVDNQANDAPAAILQKLAEAIDARLRERSPEYRLQPKGYYLPTPRIRKLDFTSPLGSALESNPIEFDEALRESKSVILRVPRNYPDHGLPWVIANYLLTAKFNSKQPIPVVVDGSHFAPPGSTLEAEITRVDQNRAINEDTGTVVFIVDGTPLHSTSRINLLISQHEMHPKAKYIFLTRDEADINEEAQFAARIGAEIYLLCDVSFHQIADFLQKNFSMPVPESEVVALRLHETFDRFDLYAHPSYFAGIPRELISTLLQANRRSELIQLSVDGLLSFAVAGDRADILLSRTTRTRFLRKLAYARLVDKRHFTQEEALIFAKDFAALHDFEIDPLNFLQTFVSNGILHFDRDNVSFSLSYMEAYLLALELKENDAAALTYFSVDQFDFDPQTFDIYCELGPSPLVVARIIEEIDTTAKELKDSTKDDYVLLTDHILPEYLRSSDRLIGLQKRLSQAADDVRANKGDTAAKQKLLDIAERVRARTAEVSETSSKDDDLRDNLKKLQAATFIWFTGSILLGSGAEHLTSDVKRGLAKLLIVLISSIVDLWTKHNQEFDFAEIKNEIVTDEFISSLSKDSQRSVEDTRVVVEGFFNILEFTFLSEPFRRTISWLCEQARHRVLRASLMAVSVDDPFGSIVHALWLADIDHTAGKIPLRRSVKALPTAIFLRINLATHILTRVYWNHWAQEERLALLDEAEEILRPVSLKFNKPELVRMVERTAGNRGKRRRRGGRKPKKREKRQRR